MQDENEIDYCSIFPFWTSLSQNQQSVLKNSIKSRLLCKGSFIFSEKDNCLGLVSVYKGTLRVFVTSDNGKEITLFKLNKGELCLFSAKCAFKELSFDIQMEAVSDTAIYIIPSIVFTQIAEKNAEIMAFINQLMSKRMDSVMTLMQQILFTSFDKRLMEYLKKAVKDSGSCKIEITHERIARDLGSAREVVSRMLKHFEDEGLVIVERGYITVLNIE